jgi:hypothetical protein
MERILALVVQIPVAAVSGFVAMLCLSTYPLFRTRPVLLSISLGNNVAFATRHALFGQGAATTMDMLLGLQTVTAIWPSGGKAYLLII